MNLYECFISKYGKPNSERRITAKPHPTLEFPNFNPNGTCFNRILLNTIFLIILRMIKHEVSILVDIVNIIRYDQTYIRSIISESTHPRTLILVSVAGFSRSGYPINSARAIKKKTKRLNAKN